MRYNINSRYVFTYLLTVNNHKHRAVSLQ